MSSVAEGAVRCNLAGFGLDGLHDLVDHDGAMRAGGSFAGGEDLGDIVRVAFWGELLVLVFEAARVFSGVAFPPFGFFVGWLVAQAEYVAGFIERVQPGILAWSAIAWSSLLRETLSYWVALNARYFYCT